MNEDDEDDEDDDDDDEDGRRIIPIALGLSAGGLKTGQNLEARDCNRSDHGVERQNLVEKLRSNAEKGAIRPKPSHYGQGIWIRSHTHPAKSIVRLEVLAQGWRIRHEILAQGWGIRLEV